MTKSLVYVLLVSLASARAHAAPLPAYYGDMSWSSSQELKDELFYVLANYHLPDSPHNDIITESCTKKSCYRQTSLSYTEARKNLFGWIHLQDLGFKDYAIMTYYCQKLITNDDMDSDFPLGPYKIPDIYAVNTEHSWPQSKFSKSFPKNLQKTDIHILFPEQDNVNILRSNHPYGEVVTVTKSPCSKAALGKNAENKTVFEPADEVKGDVARATFYFSIRYKMPIETVQEKILRRWHDNDPVDEFEADRHEMIFSIQKNRNPFIDVPELVDEIADF